MPRWLSIAGAIGAGIIMVAPVWFLLPQGPEPGAGSAASAGVPMGTGAGVYDHASAFAPLRERADVISWSVLTQVSTQVQGSRVVPVYPPAIAALDHTVQRVQGYMMPLNAGSRHRHFLLSSVPLSCPFCTPGGPESMVDVTTRDPLAYTMDVVVVQGSLAVLPADPSGLYYRMQDAAAVP